MATRDKLFVFGIIGFILLLIIDNRFDKKKCAPVRKQIDEGFSKLYSGKGINKIIIKNKKYSWNKNDFDSLIIDDFGTKEEIRRIVLNLKYIEATRYPAIQSLYLEFIMDDKSQFEIEVNKTEAKGDAEYKIYKYGECEHDITSGHFGSKELGDKIQGLADKDNE